MYLFIRLGRQTQRRWHVKSFCEHRKLAGENKLWKQACGTPDGCEWRHSFLACVRSAAVSSPQADTCGFNQLYMDPLLHSASASFPPPQSPACVSSFIPSVSSVLLFLLLWQPPSFLSQYIVSFYISHILCQHLFCIVSPFFPIFFFLAVPFPCRFLSPEHISGLCTCHPVYLEIFERYSYREAASVSLQDVWFTSHIPLLWEAYVKKTSSSSLEKCDVCISGWICFISPKSLRCKCIPVCVCSACWCILSTRQF